MVIRADMALRAPGRRDACATLIGTAGETQGNTLCRNHVMEMGSARALASAIRMLRSAVVSKTSRSVE